MYIHVCMYITCMFIKIVLFWCVQCRQTCWCHRPRLWVVYWLRWVPLYTACLHHHWMIGLKTGQNMVLGDPCSGCPTAGMSVDLGVLGVNSCEVGGVLLQAIWEGEEWLCTQWVCEESSQFSQWGQSGDPALQGQQEMQEQLNLFTKEQFVCMYVYVCVACVRTCTVL